MPLNNGYLLQGRYRILDILGLGGMGAVYRAKDENLDVLVAVKENSFLTDDYARQFRREAKILASLRHPNLPRVFDYFVIEHQGQYLVMDYIEGSDLNQWMREDKLSEYEGLLIGIAICDALIYLHDQKQPITHRDIKPGNIKITSGGEIVLVDFGLVKVLDDKEITTTAARAMTPGYSPPEQYGDTPTDQRSDIFSLGATLYAALAGYLPEDSLARTTGKSVLTPLRKYLPNVSPKTEAAIEKALSLRFEDRWQTAQEFKAALVDARDALPDEDCFSSRLVPLAYEDQDNGSIEGILRRNLDRMRSKRRTSNRKKHVVGWTILGVVLSALVLFAGILYFKPDLIPWDLSSVLIKPINDFISQRFSQIQGYPIQTPEFEEIVPMATELATTENLIIDETPNDQETTPTRTHASTDSVTITPTPTPIGGGAGVIAFVSERTGIPQIWLLDVRTGKTTQVTGLQDGACQPDWSPDGQRIVFTSPCLGKREKYSGSLLHIIELETRVVDPLKTSLEGNYDPAWSPDGDWIAYTSLINGQKQLMKIRLDDQEIVRLSDGGYNDSDPAWSPDGKQLAFTRLKSAGQIWIMDSDGDDPIQVSRSGTIDNSHPAWFPRENLILFSQVLGLGSPSKQIYGLRLENIGKENEYRIMPSGRLEYNPLMDNVDVSPDGFWLAFDYWYYDVLDDIYAMVFPGSNLLQLTDHPAKDYDPDWCPYPLE